jgi:peptidoglycan LD-endopeptidase CwlK
MPKFSQASLDKLQTCDKRLQVLFMEVIKHTDCTTICGRRNEEDQNEVFNAGKSRVQFPESAHNSYPSLAVDAAPIYADSTGSPVS